MTDETLTPADVPSLRAKPWPPPEPVPLWTVTDGALLELERIIEARRK